MPIEFIEAVPVLPSSDIKRDIVWYRENTGFEPKFGDDMYCGIYRQGIWLHLQWHANTEDDPLLGGSVARIFVKNVSELFDEFVRRGSKKPGQLRLKTDWNTNEFGLYDLNNNALFFVEDL